MVSVIFNTATNFHTATKKYVKLASGMYDDITNNFVDLVNAKTTL